MQVDEQATPRGIRLESASPKGAVGSNGFSGDGGSRADGSRGAAEEDAQEGGSPIDFDRYEEDSESVFAVARSTLTTATATASATATATASASASAPRSAGASVSAQGGTIRVGDRGVSMEDFSSKIPANILKTFEPDSVTMATLEHSSSSERASLQEQENSVLKSLVSALARALNGESVVTAPVFYSGLDWLGAVTVRPGPLKGNLVKFRTYHVQGQILAGGHVLPWKIGRVWRYSELRRVLVDEFRVLVKMHDMEKLFDPVIASFPPKTWQARNSDEVADFRAASLQKYIVSLIDTVSKIIEEREFKKNTRKGRRRAAMLAAAAASASAAGDVAAPSTATPSSSGATSSGATPSADDASFASAASDGAATSATATAPRRNSLDELVGQGLGDIMLLVVSKLLHIDRQLRKDIDTLSSDLGALISAHPLHHCDVAKEFKLTPQQAL